MFVVCLMLQACPEDFDDGPIRKIKFQNLSDKTVYVDLAADMNRYEVLEDNCKIAPHSTNVIIRLGENVIAEAPFHLVVYEESTVNKYTKEQLKELVIHDSIYECTLEYLKSCDFTVVYDSKDK